jgi:predicted signal transduction protein with EAL and GGDEF domain
MQNLLDIVNRPVYLNGQEVFVTLSAGVSKAGQDGDNADSLIKNADIALHRAKEAGKKPLGGLQPGHEAGGYSPRRAHAPPVPRPGKIAVFSAVPAPNRHSNQPHYRGRGLLRWHLPGHGVVAPLSFIYLAEQTRLIVPIGEWVLETAAGS